MDRAIHPDRKPAADRDYLTTRQNGTTRGLDDTDTEVGDATCPHAGRIPATDLSITTSADRWIEDKARRRAELRLRAYLLRTAPDTPPAEVAPTVVGSASNKADGSGFPTDPTALTAGSSSEDSRCA